MKTHVQYGTRILEPVRGLGRVQQMVKHHHEFFDGSGYPDGLTGSRIPLGARILAIADAYDTITSDRTSRRPAPPKRRLPSSSAATAHSLTRTWWRCLSGRCASCRTLFSRPPRHRSALPPTPDSFAVLLSCFSPGVFFS